MFEPNIHFQTKPYKSVEVLLLLLQQRIIFYFISIFVHPFGLRNPSVLHYYNNIL